ACHSGVFQTDHAFHAMAEPQFGPGKAERFERHSLDTGRMRVTNNPADAYAFRTPSLRNVTATAPYGHSGAHTTLAGFLAYHSDPVAGLATYQPEAILPAFDPATPDFAPLGDTAARAAIAGAVTSAPVHLTEDEAAAILAFLASLEDPTALTGRLGIPPSVPSGLTIDN
ncbi:MAG: cytochrome-c peroxidase, partial [Alphaproteobacteria bacterium]|nr:cytochrome-c peroxidase [Alphaproteobacteria bacterium]